MLSLWKRNFFSAFKSLAPTQCLLCKRFSEKLLHLATDTQLLEERSRHKHNNLCNSCFKKLPWLESRCQNCSMPLPEPNKHCGHCLNREISFDNSFCAFVYKPPISTLLIDLKHHQNIACTSTLSSLFLEGFDNMQAETLKPDVIIPIPLHWRRNMHRGFNQSLILAKPIARNLNIPLNTRALIRTKHQKSQTLLKRSERLVNLKDSFEVRGDFSGMNVALLDDVITTGATMETAAKTLKLAGAKQVSAWGVARTP